MMSGVIAAMRRTLLSCTSMVRDGLVGISASALLATSSASAADEPFITQTLANLLDLDRQEIAALTTATAVLGFSVVSAILLMHNRIRSAKTEAKLRAAAYAAG
jgi:hypothetical protein